MDEILDRDSTTSANVATALTDETVDKNEGVRTSQINQLAKISTSGSGDEEDVHNDAGIRSKSQNVKRSKYYSLE